jgi:hypothetical protein
MNRDEHIRLIAAEECMEVAQRLSKALRFGMTERQPGQPLDNRERVIEEYNDLVAAMELAGFPLQVINGRKVDAKLEKIERFLIYSAECGTLKEDAA